MISWLHHREHDEGDDEGDDWGRRRPCPGFHGGPASHPHFLPCPPVAAQRALQILLVLTNNSFPRFLGFRIERGGFYDRLERERERV